MPCCFSTYLVKDSIPLYYYTEIIGDARKPPTILAAADFNPDAPAIFGKSPPSNRNGISGSLCEQMLIRTFLTGAGGSGTSTKTICR